MGTERFGGNKSVLQCRFPMSLMPTLCRVPMVKEDRGPVGGLKSGSSTEPVPDVCLAKFTSAADSGQGLTWTNWTFMSWLRAFVRVARIEGVSL